MLSGGAESIWQLIPKNSKLCSGSVRVAWTVFGDSLSAEARDLGVNTRHLSLSLVFELLCKWKLWAGAWF